ncbi:hypothetical protein JCM6882_001980 [Rhodosporidiobolus microsporus]
MPAPQATYVSRTSDKGYDPATLSDNEDDAASDASRSTWASSSDATILGLVDGLVSAESGEAEDWKVSRVGGVPSFPLSTAPPQSSSHCLSCARPMPLLTQLYVPLPSSALERVTYLFACPSPSCRKKPGAVRAFRANAVWVEGAEEERKMKEEEERREREKREREERAKKIDLGGMIFGGGGGAPSPAAAPSNPFATAASNPFAAPSNPFAPPPPAASSNPFAPAAAPAAAANPFASPLPPSPSPAAPSAPSTAAKDTTAAPPTASASTSSWPISSSSSPPTPSFPPMYINTMYEPSSSSSSFAGGTLAKHLAAVALTDATGPDDPDLSEDESPRGGSVKEGKGAGGRTKKGAKGGEGRKDGSGKTKTKTVNSNASGGGGGGGDGWGNEGYEVQKVRGVDEVFLRFQERVAREGRQVVRYDFSTQPLPFSASSAAYRSLFPSPSSSSSSSSHPMSTPAGAPPPAEAGVGTYTPALLPRCRACGARATFEYQLMPHLVSVLSPYSSALLLRGAAEEKVGEKAGAKEEEGVEFATVWVFTCEAECTGEEGEGWREEEVRVEWEEE